MPAVVAPMTLELRFQPTAELGLARIWAEAETTLSIELADERVTVRAIADLSDEDAS